MEEQKCRIHRFLLAATQAGRRGKNYTMNGGSVWLKVTTDLLLLSLPNRDQRMHGARDIWYTMSTFKGKWEPTPVLLAQCLHVIQYRHVHIFKVSLEAGAATASLTGEGAVASAASSCRVTRMDQDWKQAVRLWSWQHAAFPCLPLETGQTRYLGKHWSCP